MFTGIVDHCGKIMELSPSVNHAGGAPSLRLRIGTEFEALVTGESIAVDGVCLTVTELVPGGFWCDVSPETLSVTTMSGFRPDRRVNLERAVRMGDRLGGHWVTGHVDQAGKVVRTERLPSGGHQSGAENEFVKLTIQLNRETIQEKISPSRFILKKGSITVNGVSLTVNEVRPDGFEVMLIPHTLFRTNLIDLNESDAVNLEFDWMVKVILSDSTNRETLIRQQK